MIPETFFKYPFCPLTVCNLLHFIGLEQSVSCEIDRNLIYIFVLLRQSSAYFLNFKDI